MHMTDALISPIVGAAMTVVSVGIAAYSIKKIKSDMDSKKIPLMGVMGAFIFAAQMINFSIPGTGSSGHLSGGLMLAVILGPYAGFLTMASILIIQALFFADGGLLALGCNIFNLGFFASFIVYPFIFKKITEKKQSAAGITTASLLAAIAGLQLGAVSVVLQTLFSGRTELPLTTFLLFMQPIHLAIGAVEGLITSAVILFIRKERPEIIFRAMENKPIGSSPLKKVLIFLGIATLLLGGVFSWFASSHPDGLEWSLFKTSGKTELSNKDSLSQKLSKIQEKTAVMPDYNLKLNNTEEEHRSTKQTWPQISAATSVAGIAGAAMVLLLAVIAGFTVSLFKRKKSLKRRV